MQTNLKAMRKYDAGLILITLVAVVAFVSVLFSLSPNTVQHHVSRSLLISM
jgi:Tfp pilus assembly protein PilE